MIRKFLIVLALLLFTTKVNAETKILAKTRIGVSTILSGPWADWGQSIANGIVLGNEDLGKKYDLDIQDDHADPAIGVGIIQDFTNLKNIRYVMLAPEEVLDVEASHAAKQQTIILSLGGMMPIHTKKYKTLVGFDNTSDAQARYLAPYLTSRKELPTVSILHGTNAYSEELGSSLEALLVARGIIVKERLEIPLNMQDFRGAVSRMLSKKPSVLFVHLGESGIATILRQLREQGYKGEIFCSMYFESDIVRKAAGEASEGVKYPYPFGGRVDSAEYHKFASHYLERFGTGPNASAALGWDAIHFLDQAISKCQINDSGCVLDKLTSVGAWEGLAGQVTLGADRTALRPFGIKEYKGGEYRWIAREIIPAR